MAASSASKVISLPELLEPILADLPQRDLLLAQRVNRQWASLITSSPLLQRKLFFQATRICPQPQENPEIEINPLIAEFFPAFTILNTMNDDYIPERDGNRHAIPGDQMIRKQRRYLSEERRNVFLRPEASWRRMFISDPPPRLGEMDIRLDNQKTLEGRLKSEYRHLNESPGARMGLIWNAMVLSLMTFPAGSSACGGGGRRGAEREESACARWRSILTRVIFGAVSRQMKRTDRLGFKSSSMRISSSMWNMSGVWASPATRRRR